MVKLFRPYIPLSVRVLVAERQMLSMTGCACTDDLGIPLPKTKASMQVRLDAALYHVSRLGTLELELHHRPALVNRKRRVWADGSVTYTPRANDPEHLIYLPKGDHDIETRVRGVGAQRSDLGQRRYNKRVEENRGKRQRPKAKIGSRGFASDSGAKVRTAKRKWPKRSFKGSA